MIQLVFDASERAAALDEGSSRGRLQLARGRRARRRGRTTSSSSWTGRIPVVYPAAGSHANKFTAALWLGSSAEAGVGCDDTRGPHREIRPVVETIPSDPARGRAAFPWIAFEGRWGELAEGVLQRPDRPEPQDPVDAADRVVETAGGPELRGSDRRALRDERHRLLLHRRRARLARPDPAAAQSRRDAALLGALPGSSIFAAVRATWTPVAPLHVARRRTWGQILSASGRMYVKRLRLFLGLGLLLIPIVFVITLVQWLAAQGCRPRRHASRARRPERWAFLAACDRDDAGAARARPRPGRDGVRARRARRGPRARALDAYRLALRRSARSSARSRIFVALWSCSRRRVFLIPVAIWLAVRWCAARPGRGARGPSAVRVAAPKRGARARTLDQGRLARRCERGDRARRRAAPGRDPDLRRRMRRSGSSTSSRASCTPSPCLSSRRHGVRVLRHPRAPRARARHPRRGAPAGDLARAADPAGLDGLRLERLVARDELGEPPALRQQLVVRPELDDAAAVEHDDLIRVADPRPRARGARGVEAPVAGDSATKGMARALRDARDDVRSRAALRREMRIAARSGPAARAIAALAPTSEPSLTQWCRTSDPAPGARRETATALEHHDRGEQRPARGEPDRDRDEEGVVVQTPTARRR